MLKSKIGYLFFVYVVATYYLFQLFLHPIIASSLQEIYTITEYNFFGVISLIFFYMTTLYILCLLIRGRYKFKFDLLNSFYYYIPVYLICFLYFAISIDFAINFETSFRHNVRLRDVGFFMSLLPTLDMLTNIVMLNVLLNFLFTGTLKSKDSRLIILIFLSTIFSFNSSLHIVKIFIAFFLIFYPKVFTINFSIKSIFIGIILLILAGVLVVFSGTANKIGIDATIELVSSDVYKNFIEHTALRVMTSYVSLVNMMNNHLYDFNMQFNALLSGFELMHQRVGIIFGSSPDELIDSINRINRNSIMIASHDRAGASPGLLASMLYFPYIVPGFIFITLFSVAVVNTINRYTSTLKNLNFLTVLTIFYFFLPLADSPITYFTIITPSFIYFLVLYILSYYKVQDNKHV